MNEIQEVWRDLAGPLYDELMRNKEAALASLSHADKNVRIAAIWICYRHWDFAGNADFLGACRKIAVADPDDSVRGAAIDAIGRAMEGSQDAFASSFLGDLAMDGNVAGGVRRNAYFALRAIPAWFDRRGDRQTKRCAY